jgi:hypothetical protein
MYVVYFLLMVNGFMWFGRIFNKKNEIPNEKILNYTGFELEICGFSINNAIKCHLGQLETKLIE